MLAGWWSSVIPEIEPPTATNMYSSFCGNNPVLKKWTDMKQNYLSNHISVVDNPILGPTQKKFGPTYEAHSSLQNPHKIENDMGKNTCIPQIVPKYLVSSLHPPCFWYFLIGAFFLISKKNRKGLYMISMAMPWLPKSMAFHGDSGACFELLRRFPGLRRALAVQTPVQWEPCGCAGGCDVQPVHVTSHIQYMCNLFAWSNMYTVTNYYYTTQKKTGKHKFKSILLTCTKVFIKDSHVKQSMTSQILALTRWWPKNQQVSSDWVRLFQPQSQKRVIQNLPSLSIVYHNLLIGSLAFPWASPEKTRGLVRNLHWSPCQDSQSLTDPWPPVQNIEKHTISGSCWSKITATYFVTQSPQQMPPVVYPVVYLWISSFWGPI